MQTLVANGGRATMHVAIGRDALNPAGALHGGVLYLLCDVCAYAATLSQLDAAHEAVTHDLHVCVLRPAAAGETLEVTAQVRRLGRSLCFIDVEAHVAERLVATARVTKSVLAR